MFYEGSVAGAPVSTTSVNDGNWHQIVAVYQPGGSKSIYIDGALESTQVSEPFGGNSASFLIGGTSDGNGIEQGSYSGLIDDVQIYNHALSDTDVKYLYQNPGKVVAAMDCSQKLAVAQAQLAAANAANAALQAQLATCNENLAAANQEIQDLVLPLHVLTLDFRTTFKDPTFQIRGATSVEQMQNLVAEILDLPRGQQQQLYIDLGGHKGKGKK